MSVPPSDSSPIPASPATPDRAVIREAVQWLVRLHSGEAGAEDLAACLRWRQAHPAHEQAWQKAERLSRQFGAVPAALGVPVLTRAQRGVDRRALAKTLVALGVAVPLGWTAYREMPWQAWTADYATATGERRDVTLVDGSRVMLNTGSAVDVRYSDQVRLIVLRRGEIFVRTAPDLAGRDRPLVVATPQGRLRALGTRFVVRLIDTDEPAGPATRLSVLQHRVEVTPQGSGQPLVVVQGYRVRVTADGIGQPSLIPDAALLPDQAPGWSQGVLYAQDMRLDAFLAELSRYRAGVIRCAPEVAALRISGAFQLADTDYVLAMLRETLPIRIVLRTRWWVGVLPRDTV